MDWQVIGAGVATFLAAFGAVLMKWKPWAASSKADTAANEAEAAMYQRLRDDIDAMAADLRRLRAELDRERTHCRNLEQYVWQLQGLMRAAGIEPPPMPAYPVLTS